MPRFSQEPPRDENRHGFRLIRTPAAGALRAIVASSKLIGCPTHFVGNRTVPCEKPNCSPCNNGISWRWHGYLFVLTQPAKELCIFEMTAAASDPFTAYYERMGTLRGCLFQAQRINAKHNGRVLIQCKPADLNHVELPEAPDVPKLLCHIWNISPQQLDPNPKNPRPPAAAIRIDRDRPELKAYDPADDDSVAALLSQQTPKPNGRGRSTKTET